MQVIEKLLPIQYKYSQASKLNAMLNIYKLVLLLIVFICSASGDLTLLLYNMEVDHYQQLI